MNNIELAQIFEDSLSYLMPSRADRDPKWSKYENNPQYSCEAIVLCLHRRKIKTEEYGPLINKIKTICSVLMTPGELQGAGPGCVFHEFPHYVWTKPHLDWVEMPTEKRQMVRALWLTLLAEMAEQGDL